MSYNSPRDKHIPIVPVQVHPRVLKQEPECCDCAYGKDVPGWTFNLNCTFHDREVNRHDDCSAFTAKQKE